MTLGGLISQPHSARTYNLRMHTRNHIPSDIVVGGKEFKAGTLIEIRQEDASIDCLWIAFEVGACRDDIPKDVVSFEQSLATQLRLKPHAKIMIRQAQTSDHAVNLAELLIKDQYLSQADLWLLASHLGGSCLHVGKLIEFQGMRATVKHLWRQGDSLLSGYISPDPHQTKVVFRSATASISIFILMTREMWQYDLAGDLCFQLVVCGLLTDLCSAWRDRGCTHDVTIAMATRVVYEATSVSDFAEDVRPTIQSNAKGQFFEDLYEVIVQNERFDDWSDILLALNKSFIHFDERVLRLDRKDLPRRRIAFSAEAPILESINVVLNAMDTYRMDHRFDRTGHALVLISASQGVYDVDKRIKSITKKRVIESGLAVDLVCVLPQPFHPVPLFRMYEGGDFCSRVHDNELTFEYALPNDWINVSFYQAAYSSIAFSTADVIEEFDGDDKRAVAVFEVPEDQNFANPLMLACIDIPESDSNISFTKTRRQLFNPFLSSSDRASSDRERASRPHANRWLHALPLNELGQAVQVHHSRYRASTSTGRSRRQTASNENSNDILTGVDWKSLVLPAVLPNTAAAGIGLDAWLKEVCVESPHEVPFSFQESPDAEEKASQNLAKASMSTAGFRRPQQPKEVFDLLVLLRLAAGFQLVLSPPQPDQNPKEVISSSPFFKIHRTPPVLMASGRYYQKLELNEPDQRVIVTKFVRSKRGVNTKAEHIGNSVHKYRFLFRVPDIESFNFASTEFANRRPDLLNLWASLDYHVTQKTPDIDLNDYSIRECFWKSYFGVLPLLNLPTSAKTKVYDIDWAKQMEDIVGPQVQCASLTRFVGYMNGLSTSRPTSQTTLPSTPNESSEKPFQLTTHLLAGLDSQGLSYLESASQQAQQVRFYTTYDAVNWMLGETQQKLFGFATKEACMNFLNECYETGRIFSPSLSQKGLDKLYYGIYYFSFVSPGASALGSRGDNLIEIAFGHDEQLPKEASVMLSVDASGRGGRHELAMIVHDSYFLPGCAFRLRLEWLFASGSFLCELVDSWHHRARSWGIHFLPVPSNAFDLTDSDPLRLIIVIPYQPENIATELLGGENASEEICDVITDTLLKNFAFIDMVCNNKKDGYFVHLSGVAFIRRVPGAFEWAWNFQVSRRWQTILENESGDLLLANFRRACSNSDNLLLDLVKQKELFSS